MKKYLIYEEFYGYDDGRTFVSDRKLTGDAFTNKDAAEKCCKLLNEIGGFSTYKFLAVNLDKEYDSISQFKAENKEKLIKMQIDYILNKKQYTLNLLSWEGDVYKRRPVEMYLGNLVSAANELGAGVEFSTSMYGYDDVEFKKRDLPKIKQAINDAYAEVEKLKSKLQTKQIKEKIAEQQCENKQNKEKGQ